MRLKFSFIYLGVILKLVSFFILINCNNVIKNKKLENSRDHRVSTNSSEEKKSNHVREGSNSKFIKNEEKNFEHFKKKSIFESLEEEIQALLKEIKEDKNS